MREIKFRAWDKKEKKMLDLDDISVMTAGRIGASDAPWKFMQYTGSKDKKGVKIYEGDILKGIHREDGKEIKLVGGVKYLPSYFFIEDAWYRPQPNANFEVIGNIWENKEVLK